MFLASSVNTLIDNSRFHMLAFLPAVWCRFCLRPRRHLSRGGGGESLAPRGGIPGPGWDSQPRHVHGLSGRPGFQPRVTKKPPIRNQDGAKSRDYFISPFRMLNGPESVLAGGWSNGENVAFPSAEGNECKIPFSPSVKSEGWRGGGRDTAMVMTMQL